MTSSPTRNIGSMSCAVLFALATPGLRASPDIDPSTPETLDAIVVTATRHASDQQDVAASISVQDMAELDRKGFYAGGDEFRGVPGVFFRRGQGDNEDILSINFRGFIGNHGNDTFLGLLDGLPFVSPDDELLLQEIPYAAVDRVELVRGPVSALYGRGGIAGAVNYITRSPQEDGGALSLKFGSDGYQRIQIEGARAGHADGFDLLGIATDEKADGWRENNQRETSNLFLKGNRQFGDALNLSVYLDYMDKSYRTGGAIPTYADGTRFPLGLGRDGYYGMPGSGQDVKAWFAAAKLSWDISPASNWTNTVLVRRRESVLDQSFYDGYLFDPDSRQMGYNGFFSDNNAPTAFFESVFDWRGERHHLIAGASIEHAEPKTRSGWFGQNGFTFECGFQWYANVFDTDTGAWLNRDHPCQTRDVTADSHAHIDFHALYLQDEWQLSERWLATLGIRYDAFRRKVDWRPTASTPEPSVQRADDSHVSPKASLSYRFDHGQAYLTYGQGYSSNFGPVWQWDPTAYFHDTRPSTLDSLELGYKGSWRDGRVQWAAALFRMQQKERAFEIENPLSWDDPSEPGSLILSGPPLESRGAELTLSWRIGDATRLDAGASYVDAEWQASDFFARYPALTDLTGKVPVGVPETSWSLNLDHRFSAWLVGRIGYEWYDDYFISLDNARKGGGHGLANLSLTLTPPAAPRLTAQLAVSNLFDREYDYFYGGARDVGFAVPGVPRQAFVELRYAF